VPNLGGTPEIIVSPVWMKKALIPERMQAYGFLRPVNIARMVCKWWGPPPKKSHLVSPLSTNASRRRCGRTRGAWSSKNPICYIGQPRAALRSHKACCNLNAEVLSEAQQRRWLVPTYFFPACYSSLARNGDDEE
jgi:hypothetical protein